MSLLKENTITLAKDTVSLETVTLKLKSKLKHTISAIRPELL